MPPPAWFVAKHHENGSRNACRRAMADSVRAGGSAAQYRDREAEGGDPIDQPLRHLRGKFVIPGCTGIRVTVGAREVAAVRQVPGDEPRQTLLVFTIHLVHGFPLPFHSSWCICRWHGAGAGDRNWHIGISRASAVPHAPAHDRIPALTPPSGAALCKDGLTVPAFPARGTHK